MRNSELKASVMEIERFAIHDGPGIRTLVFLQGCPLHCLWCANPESQMIGRHLLYDKRKCVGCGACVKSCSHQAISWVQDHPVFLREACAHCGKCMEACIQEAIRFSGKLMSVGEILEVVMRDKDYYRNSGGGITISGGEPFVQFEAFMALLEGSGEMGLHTAVETCGHVPLDRVQKAEPLLDAFLFDLKHISSVKFREYTGGDLAVILRNLEYVASTAPQKITIRVPVIPGFNADEDTLNGILERAAGLGVKTVHLLPYHTMGMVKYEQLDKPYLLPCTTGMRKEELDGYRKVGEEIGVNVQIGG